MAEPSLSRRPSPVILVIPIVLALAGIGVSVMLYLQHYKEGEGTKAKEDQALLKLADASKKYQAVEDRRDALTAPLGYNGSDYQTWLESKLGGAADFKRAMEAREATVKQLTDEAAKLKADIDKAGADIVTVQAAIVELHKAKTAELEQKTKDLDNLDKTFKPGTDDQIKRQNEAGKRLVEKERERDLARKQRAEAKRRQDDLLTAIQDEVVRLQDAVAERRTASQLADGRVVSVPPGAGTVIIDLGRHQRVRQGLRFQVIDKGQLIPDPRDPKARPTLTPTAKAKGEIEVTQVFDDQCRCSILNLNFADPILPNDALYNAVFDPYLATQFVTVGLLDLNGDGREDPELLDQLVKSIGAVVQPAVDIKTDFLIVGKDWSTADPELRRRYYRDQDQIKAAEDLQVTFMSVRRFLEYVGVQTGAGERNPVPAAAATASAGSPTTTAPAVRY